MSNPGLKINLYDPGCATRTLWYRRGDRDGPRRSSDRQWQGLATKLAERSRTDAYERNTSDDEQVIYDVGAMAREPRYQRHRARGIQGDDYDDVSNAAAAWHRTAEWLSAKSRHSAQSRYKDAPACIFFP